MAEKAYNIIIRLPNWIGDIIMALPTVHNLFRNYPDSRIVFLTKTHLTDFVNLILPGKDIRGVNFKEKSELNSVAEELSHFNFKLGIIFPLSFSSARDLKRFQPEQVIGFNSELRRFFLDIPVKYSKKTFRNIHLRTRYLELLTPLNLKLVEVEIKPELDKQITTQVLEKFGLVKENYLILAPGATYGPAKRWGLEKFVETGIVIQNQYGLTPVVTGLDKEIPENKNIIPKTFINLIGKTTLTELVYLSEGAELFISNDSGAMHIADLLNKKLVAIFGSTNPGWTGPVNPDSRVVAADIDCRPCYNRKCRKGFICLKSIDSKQVLNKVEEIIKE